MDIMEAVRASKIIAIVRGMEETSIARFAQALYEGGISMIEVTFDQAHPDRWGDTARAIERLRGRFDGKVRAGAGTVLTLEQLELAHRAGAEYIVSPDANPAIIRRTRELGMCSFPGVMTPSEAVRAHDCGANAVKVFPASVLGPAYFKALKAPLPHIEMLAVGGVNENNAADFLRAGAIGLGIGGSLTRRELVERGAFEQITALAAACVRAVNAGV